MVNAFLSFPNNLIMIVYVENKFFNVVSELENYRKKKMK